MENLAKPSPKIALSDFALLVASMSRFISGLALISPFTTSNIGLSEWLVLMSIADNEGISNNQIARSLGVSGQRANQIVSSLAKMGLLSISTSKTDSRRNEICMSQVGRAELDLFNRSLEPLVQSIFSDKGRLLVRLSKQTRRLAKFVAGVRMTANSAKKAQDNYA